MLVVDIPTGYIMLQVLQINWVVLTGLQPDANRLVRGGAVPGLRDSDVTKAAARPILTSHTDGIALV